LGRFVLVLGRPRGTEHWSKRALFQVPGGQLFSALRIRSGVIEWHGCLECDDVCTVAKSGDSLALKC
jgi:hypothetical protein